MTCRAIWRHLCLCECRLRPGLLYLSDGGSDFDGGRLVFETASGEMETAVTPRRGTLVLFTSGEEFPHRVEKVLSGTRLALTIAFTCDETAAVTDLLARAPF
eukprot:6174615-Pleurochrysis_carterae.AAC.3